MRFPVPPPDPFAPRPKQDRSKRYRWLISYADMITLLMAMFVLMLSLSSMDQHKFEDQAAEMRRVFNRSLGLLPSPGQPGAKIDLQTIDEDIEAAARQRQWRSHASQQVRSALASEIASKATTVLETDREVIIRFPDTSAFSSGSADLQNSILPALDRVVEVLRRVEGQVVVSGHTDNVPVATARFRSNWDLAVSRAVSVVHYLVKDTRLSPGRVTAQGFADSRPLAGNDTPEGRAQNRRVEIAITMPDSLAEDDAGKRPARR